MENIQSFGFSVADLPFYGVSHWKHTCRIVHDAILILGLSFRIS